MTVALRPYQQQAVHDISTALRHHKRVLFRLPTGGGKTVIVGHMMLACAQKLWREWFLCHRMELIDQTAATLHRIGLDHGYVAAGYPEAKRDTILVCSVQTIGRRLDRLEAPKIIFVDEAHHSVAGTWSAIIRAFPDAWIVGVTATPERLDGRGLGDIFTSLVTGPSERWLIDQGYLSDFRAWSHPAPDLSAMKTRGADFDPAALTAAMSDGALLGDMVEHYMSICPGARAVAFCVSIEHAYKVRDAFRAAGVRCEELDGKAPKDERRKVIRAYRNGDIDLLTSVDLFGEGFDLPEMRCAILGRPTMSLGMMMQQCGRAFRPVYADGFDLETQRGRLDAINAGPKQGAIILDHAGNIHRHGMPDIERGWSLSGRPKKQRDAAAPAPRICPRCFGASPANAITCRYCHWEFIVNSREVDEIPGNLEEINRERERIDVASQPATEAETFEEVMAIFEARGHVAPWSAADGVMLSRGTPVGELQFRRALEGVAAKRGYNSYWVRFQMRSYLKRRGGRAA